VTTILAIDPGTSESGWCILDDGQLIHSDVYVNDDTADFNMMELVASRAAGYYTGLCDVLAVEMVASYGMPVGAEVFRTVWWTGRFAEAWWTNGGVDVREVYRRDVKLHLCQSPRAKDANIRQALIDRWGGKAAAIGNAKNPGPLYGVKSHAWAALAVAVYVNDEMRRRAA
jgi:hypothetical protein